MKLYKLEYVDYEKCNWEETYAILVWANTKKQARLMARDGTFGNTAWNNRKITTCEEVMVPKQATVLLSADR